MWAMMYKNLLVWHPLRGQNVWVLLLGAVLGLLDMGQMLPVPFWAAAMLYLFVLGSGAGLGLFSTDARNDSHRFLDMLPLPRWKRWLANWINEVIVICAAMVLLSWHRVATWAPPWEAAASEAESQQFLMPTRFALLLGGGGLVFLVFAHALFWRTFFRRDGLAQFPILISGAVVEVLPAAVIVAMGIMPSLADIAGVAWLLGGMFSLAAAAGYLLPPATWHRALAFVAVGVPCLVLVLAAEAGIVYGAAHRWARMERHEPLEVMNVEVLTGHKPVVLVGVRSPRSGPHLLSVDPQAATVLDLGRWLSTEDTRFPDRMLCGSGLNRYGLVPFRGESLVCINAFTGKVTPTEFTLGGNLDYQYCRWTPGGEAAVLVEMETMRSEGRVRLLDTELRVTRVLSETSGFARTAGKWILVKGPLEGQVPTSLRYTLGEQEPLAVPVKGPLVGVSPDVRWVLVAKWEARDAEPQLALVLVDLETLAQRELVHAGEFPGLPLDLPEGSGRRWHLPVFAAEDGWEQGGPLPLVVDWDRREAYCVLRRVEGAEARHRVVRIGLDSGERTELAGEAQLPTSPAHLDETTYRRQPSVSRSPYGERVLHLECRGRTWRIPLDGGEVQEEDMSDRLVIDPRPISGKPSPGGNAEVAVQAAGDRRDHREGYEVSMRQGQGEPVVLFRSKTIPFVKWLSSEELVVGCGGRVWVMDLAGREKRVLLDHPSIP